MFYDIFINGNYVEYHVAHKRTEVLNRQAMSRRINTYQANPTEVAEKIVSWLDEADFYRCERVHSKGG